MTVSAGSHKAVVDIQAKTSQASAQLKKLAADMAKLEGQLEKTGIKAQTAGAKIDKVGTSALGSAKAFFGSPAALAGSVIGAVYAIDRLAERETMWSDVNQKLRIDVTKAADAVGWGTDKINLATSASKLNAAGLAESADQYADLAAAVDRAADAHGVDLAPALETVTRAVLKGNTRGLEQLGIIIDTDKVFGDYASTLGKTTAELSLAEKQQAILNEVLADGERNAFMYGESVENAAHGWVELKNRLVDQLDQISDAIFNNDRHFANLSNTVEGVFMDMGAGAEAAEWQVMKLARAAEVVGDVWAFRFGKAAEDARALAGVVAGGPEAFAASQQADRARMQEEENSRKIVDAARRTARIVQEAQEAGAAESKGKRGGGGRSAKVQESIDLYEAEAKRILLMDREIEKLKALGKSTEGLERARYELATWVAGAKGKIAEKEEIEHKRALARIALQAEWDQKRADASVARLEAEGAATARKTDLERIYLEGKLIGEENDIVAHEVAMQIAAVEAEALAAELDTRQQILAARFPADEAERMEIQAELLQVDHEQRMAVLTAEQEQRRLGHELTLKIEAAEKKAREKRVANIRATASMADSVLAASAEAAQMSADTGNESGRRAAEAFMKIRGVMAIAQGAFDTAQAVSSFASFNYVQGAMYVASAATNFITGAKLLAGDPGHGASMSSMSVGGATGGGGRGGGAQTAPEPTSVPRSVPDDERGDAGGPRGASSDRGGRTIIVQGDVVGDVTDSWAAKLSKKTKRVGYSSKVTA